MRIILLGAWLASLVLVQAVPNARRFPGHHFYLAKMDAWQPQEIARILRGGSSDPQIHTGSGSPPSLTQADEQLTPPRPQIPQQYDYPAEQALPLTGDDNTPFEETFQQKVDAWRQYQMEHAEEQRSSLSPRDDKGRLKLLTSLGKGSRAFTFFLLMWRNVHLYEVVDTKYKGTIRYMGVFPLTFLFISNLAGVVASISSAGHSSKKRLKAILNLNKLVEVFLIFCYVFRLLFDSSNMVPREIYIASILHSVFFILQCQATTRFVWDEALLPSPQTPVGTSQPNQENNDFARQAISGEDYQEFQQNPYGY